jgi:hypothetical protein
LRHLVFALLRSDAPAATVDDLRKCLVPQSEVEYTVPARIGDYTDFYTSIDHALNITRLFNPEGDVTPNFRWIPTAYHGRVSTIGVSGQRFHRPMGQTMAPGAKAPTYHACARLDYELELGVWIGEGNAAGEPIPLERAEEHIFGICLLNDWSARDIQFWEMAPLGPFPREELRDHHLAVDRDDGSARALPPGLDAAGQRAPTARLPGEHGEPRQRRDRHQPGGLARKRQGAREQERALAPVAHELQAPVLERGADGGAPHDGRLQAELRATCSAAARSRARGPERPARSSS